MGLATLVLGLVLFIGAHVVTTQRKLRADLIARIGEGPYKGIYALVALIGIVLIGFGFANYRATGWIDVWYPPAWTRHIVVALMWPACICVVAAYIPGDIKRKLKHPMLVGVKIWGFAHLTANGDLGSIILFGSILGWAVFDRITLKRRTDAGAPPIPLGGRRNDYIAIAVGTVLYLLLGAVFHPLVIGVPAFGMAASGH
jgi:uncharacterized membrane protein